MISITYNVAGWSGWPHGSLKQLSYSEIGELFAKALKRYNPDIITFSEAPPCSIIDVIANELDMKVSIFPSAWCWPGVILTKYKILKTESFSLNRKYWSRDLFSRHWGKCILETEFGKVILHSLHLYPNPNTKIHENEVLEVIKTLKEDIKSGLSIILQGDLNHEPSHNAYEKWLQLGLVDTFAKAGIGDYGTFRSDDPKRRIDYIFAYGPIVNHLVECRVLKENPFSFDKKEKRSLSDHLPVMAIFR